MKPEKMTSDLTIPNFTNETLLSDKDFATKLSQKLDITVKSSEKTFLKNTRNFFKDSLKKTKKFLPT